MSGSDITKVIDKLSPLAQHVYAVYLRQQYLIGVEQIIAAVVLIGFFITSFKIARWAWIEGSKDENKYEEGPFIVMIVCVLAMLACGIIALSLGLDAMSHLLNPEYGAVQGILGR